MWPFDIKAKKEKARKHKRNIVIGVTTPLVALVAGVSIALAMLFGCKADSLPNDWKFVTSFATNSKFPEIGEHSLTIDAYSSGDDVTTRDECPTIEFDKAVTNSAKCDITQSETGNEATIKSLQSDIIVFASQSSPIKSLVGKQTVRHVFDVILDYGKTGPHHTYSSWALPLEFTNSCIEQAANQAGGGDVASLSFNIPSKKENRYSTASNPKDAASPQPRGDVAISNIFEEINPITYPNTEATTSPVLDCFLFHLNAKNTSISMESPDDGSYGFNLGGKLLNSKITVKQMKTPLKLTWFLPF